jgi:hypothetical protein
MSEEDEPTGKFTPEEDERLRERPSLWFKLDDNKNVIPATLEEFEQMARHPEMRIVGKTKEGPYVVSTVFLMIDHGFGGSSLFFETMIWSEKTEKHSFFDYQVRYATYQEALAGHQAVVELVKEGTLP